MDAPNVQKLQQSVEGAMEDMQRRFFFPLQKKAFLCSAKCCDDPQADMQRLQECTNRCAAPIQAAEQAIYSRLGEFQERFQRCAVRCKDKAQEGLARDPNDRQVAAAQKAMASCMDACGAEYAGQVPRLKADVEATLKKLG